MCSQKKNTGMEPCPHDAVLPFWEPTTCRRNGDAWDAEKRQLVKQQHTNEDDGVKIPAEEQQTCYINSSLLYQILQTHD